MATAGFRSAPSVLIVPLEEAFGWSRSDISLAVAINVLLYGLIAPFAAALMERFGIRRVVMTALTVVSAGSAATNPIRFAFARCDDAAHGWLAGVGGDSKTRSPQRFASTRMDVDGPRLADR